MKLIGSTLVGVLFLASATAWAAETLHTAAEIRLALDDVSNENRTFTLNGTVVYAYRHAHCSATIQDTTGQIRIFDGTDKCGTLLTEGRNFRICGRLRLVPDPPLDKPAFHAVYESAEIAGTAEPSPSDAGLTVTGILRDVFVDEIDPNFTFLVINNHSDCTYAVFSSSEDPHLKIMSMIGFEISLAGADLSHSQAANSSGEGRMRQLTPLIHTHASTIKPTSKMRTGVFDVPDLPALKDIPSSEVAQLGRRKIAGMVITRWDGNKILLQTDDDRLVFATLSAGAMPSRGDRILVSGVPETTVYYFCLNHANWKLLGATDSLPRSAVIDTDLKTLFSTPTGQKRFAMPLNGATIRVRGRFLGTSLAAIDLSQFCLEDDSRILTVDYSSAPNALRQIPPNSLIDVTGTCITKLESNGATPRINGLFLVINRDSDIRVVKHPSWWTATRFATTLAVLVLALICVLIWNLTLRKVSEHRGAELANEKVAVIESELKVYERTRLAIELHDLLSQMLSGISMQIGTVRKFFGTNTEKALHHLDIADKTLHACRESLRDCLWDLRNRALEESDMEKAIRATLEPHVENTSVSLRFNVPRERLTDNAAHAILSIIRELTVNALRHGKATALRIAGCIENGKVLFSVADNGLGFDPDAAPGMPEGHFGLQGVRERIEGFGGDMTITSKIGRGAKVSIGLNLPQDNSQAKHE